MKSTLTVTANVAGLLTDDPSARIAWLEKFGPASKDDVPVTLVADARLWVQAGHDINTDGTVRISAMSTIRGLSGMPSGGIYEVRAQLEKLVAETGGLPGPLGGDIDVTDALNTYVAKRDAEKAKRAAESAEREAEYAARTAREKAVAEAGAAAAKAERDEMAAWIEAHGSARLRRCLAEQIECRAAYRDERLAAERPGWRWYDSVPWVIKDPRNPPAAAFDILDAARKTAPDAALSWVDHDGARGYVADGTFLGETIVLGEPAQADDADDGEE